MNLTRHPLKPADRAAMAAMREAIGPNKPSFTPGFRPPFDELMEHTPDAPGVTYAKGAVGGIPGCWCRPSASQESAAILYLHGGAYIVGSAWADRHLVGQIAARAQAVAFAAEYRLAPEHPFPAAVDDAAAAYRGLVAEGFQKIAIVGDSAGGGLTLVTLSVVTAEGHRPMAAIAMSPWTDLSLSSPSMETHAGIDPLLSKETLAAAAEQILIGQDPYNPLASPLFGNLTGLAPVMVHVSEDEILLDDSRRYATRFAEAGGTAELHVWEGMTHVFPASVGTLTAAGEALDLIGDFLKPRLS